MRHIETILWVTILLFISSLLVNLFIIYRLRKEKRSRELNLDRYECRLCDIDLDQSDIHGHSCSNCMCSQDSQGRTWWRRKRTKLR